MKRAFNIKTKKAFTLIELLVYMAIMGFIILVAGRVFSDSASMRVRTQNMTKVTEEINKVAELIKEDLSQMGVKIWKNATEITDTEDIFLVSGSVYMSAADSSSFDLLHGEKENDSIAFKKIAFNNDGEYVGVRLISWALDSADNVLRRRCVTLASTTSAVDDPELSLCPKSTDLNAADAIIMAKDVQAFYLLPSTPGAQSQAEQTASGLPFGGYTSTGAATFGLLDRGSAGFCSDDDVCAIGNIYQPGDAGTSSRVAVISGFKYNEKKEETQQQGTLRNELYVSEPYPSMGESYSNCKKFNFKKGEAYYVQFETPIGSSYQDTTMSLFQPGIDHAAIGFRRQNGETITELPRDFLFYAPQQLTNSSNKKHNFDFSVSSDVDNACAMFTFAFYSPRASGGILRIKDFEIGQKNDAFRFVRNNNNEPSYSQNYATLDDESENLQNKKNVKAFELTLEINKGGEIVSTRHYVIPTPNNGISAVGTVTGLTLAGD